MQEVKRLKNELINLKGKEQVRPSQDNRDPVVKKLEMGSNFTSSAHQQGQKEDQAQDSKKENSKTHQVFQVSRERALCKILSNQV